MCSAFVAQGVHFQLKMYGQGRVAGGDRASRGSTAPALEDCAIGALSRRAVRIAFSIIQVCKSEKDEAGDCRV